MRRKKNIIDDLWLRMSFEEASDEEMIVLISEKVQDLEMGDCTGRSLLWHAAFLNRRKVAEWLIERGANVNTQDENSFSALHIAVQERNIDMATYLLHCGADVNIQDKFGNTPIMRTDRATPDEIFCNLLENGADVDIKNIAGVSFRDICFGNVSAYVQGLIDRSKKWEYAWINWKNPSIGSEKALALWRVTSEYREFSKKLRIFTKAGKLTECEGMQKWRKSRKNAFWPKPYNLSKCRQCSHAVCWVEISAENSI